MQYVARRSGMLVLLSLWWVPPATGGLFSRQTVRMQRRGRRRLTSQHTSWQDAIRSRLSTQRKNEQRIQEKRRRLWREGGCFFLLLWGLIVVGRSPLVVNAWANTAQQRAALPSGLRWVATRVTLLVAWLQDVVAPVLIDLFLRIVLALLQGVWALTKLILPSLGTALLMVLATLLVMAVTLLYPTLQAAGRALRQDMTTSPHRGREPFPATRRLWDRTAERIMVAADEHHHRKQRGPFHPTSRYYDENERYF